MKTITIFILVALAGVTPIICNAQSWSLTGNAGTNPTKNYVGTQDFLPFIFKLNNSCAGIISVSDVQGDVAYGYKSYIINSAIPRSQNTALGHGALSLNTNADSNVAVGFKSLYSNVAGNVNIGLGCEALYLAKTGYNTAVGYEALLVSNFTGMGDAVGYESQWENTSGLYNSGLGSGSLFRNVSGMDNLACGYHSLYSVNTLNPPGTGNIGIGQSALLNGTGYDYFENIGIGSNTIISGPDGYNTAVGYGVNITGSYPQTVFSTAIGYMASCTYAGEIQFGNSSVTSIGGYVNWSNISDGRYKKNIIENVPGLAFINKLQPVTYNLDVTGINAVLNKNKTIKPPAQDASSIAAKEQILYSGFIGQEVEKSAKELGYDFRGVDAPKDENGFYGLRYATFVVPLVKAVQELDAAKNNLGKECASLLAESDQLKAEGSEQDAQLDRLETTLNNLIK